jgi:hypothetical protein
MLHHTGKIVVPLKGVATMTQKFVRYSPDVEQEGARFRANPLSALSWIGNFAEQS